MNVRLRMYQVSLLKIRRYLCKESIPVSKIAVTKAQYGSCLQHTLCHFCHRIVSYISSTLKFGLPVV